MEAGMATEPTMVSRALRARAVLTFLFALPFLSGLSAGPARAGVATGPLVVHPANPRYLSDDSERAVYLTGSHVWNNVIDHSSWPTLDFDAHLDFLVGHNHNFIRLWTQDVFCWPPSDLLAPMPYARTGPGTATDGRPKFDLTLFDAEYFDRVRTRTIAARDRGVYVAVMFFEGCWAPLWGQEGWALHPYNPANNVNDLGATFETVHTLDNAAVLAVHEAYVRKMIDTVNDLDNVLLEIANEDGHGSVEWQYHMIDFARTYESTKPKQHVIGMTFRYPGGTNQQLFDSSAEWISPNSDGGYRDDPPEADGAKVVISDTDHLWGIGGDRAWVWKSFVRGHNPIYMDPVGTSYGGDDPVHEDPRRAMGHTLTYAEKMNLAAMLPRSALASTGYCLAAPGREYLVYLPSGGTVTVDLSVAAGAVAVEWFNPGGGTVHPAQPADGGASVELTAPFAGDAVLYLKADGGEPVLTSIVVTPPSATIQSGGSVDLVASALDQYGGPMSAELSWAVSGGGSLSQTTGSTVTFTSDGTSGSFTVAVSSGAVQTSAEVTVMEPGALLMKINCGANGIPVEGWEADDPYVSGGEDFTFGGTPDTAGVENAAPAGVYRTVRHLDHSYDFADVPDGTYTVRIHFYDDYEAGRAMDYLIEGVQVLDGFNVAAEVGTGKALVKEFTVTVSDGDGLQIVARQNSGDDVFDSGIEILASGEAPPVDSDGDGMDDAWELSFFGDLAHDGTDDTDGDGATDYEEFVAGTDPRGGGPGPDGPGAESEGDSSGRCGALPGDLPPGPIAGLSAVGLLVLAGLVVLTRSAARGARARPRFGQPHRTRERRRS